MNDKQSPPASYYLLFVLILFQGFSGLYGGAMLVLDPSGYLLQLPLSLLSGSPFYNYTIPGFILLVLLGIVPLFVGFALWKRYPWSGTGAFLIGVMLVVWIGVQIVMIGYRGDPPLQAIYGSIGLLILITVSTPTLRQYLRSQQQ